MLPTLEDPAGAAAAARANACRGGDILDCERGGPGCDHRLDRAAPATTDIPLPLLSLLEAVVVDDPPKETSGSVLGSAPTPLMLADVTGPVPLNAVEKTPDDRLLEEALPPPLLLLLLLLLLLPPPTWLFRLLLAPPLHMLSKLSEGNHAPLPLPLPLLPLAVEDSASETTIGL